MEFSMIGVLNSQARVALKVKFFKTMNAEIASPIARFAQTTGLAINALLGSPMTLFSGFVLKLPREPCQRTHVDLVALSVIKRLFNANNAAMDLF
jgi:hypothetical protein